MAECLAPGTPKWLCLGERRRGEDVAAFVFAIRLPEDEALIGFVLAFSLPFSSFLPFSDTPLAPSSSLKRSFTTRVFLVGLEGKLSSLVSFLQHPIEDRFFDVSVQIQLVLNLLEDFEFSLARSGLYSLKELSNCLLIFFQKLEWIHIHLSAIVIFRNSREPIFSSS